MDSDDGDASVKMNHNGQWSTNTENAKSSFLEAGVRMRTGGWTLEEKTRVQKNVDRYLVKHPGLTVEDVVFSWTKDQRRGFYKKAGKGIRRPLNSIYTYMKRRYHPHNYLGSYTEEEEARLSKLYAKYGPKWTKIGRKLKRSPETVAMKYRYMEDKRKVVEKDGHIKCGHWSEEESHMLKAAMAEFHDKFSMDTPVVWDSVARRIPGKTAKQCRSFWTQTGSIKAFAQEWTAADDIKMITVLFSTEDMGDGEIPWAALQQEHWTDWTVAALKVFWQRLRAVVPGYTALVLDELLLWLYDHHLPKLQASITSPADQA
ncbi:cyclin-D-binding Myb-like transcription factor 1 [Sycon ciliatum]|uniref:cyclin-D-binding Myb-like transcription factor 1 n=1 Tax=Sycon ciliatum TaxID=27933 RepID=UPI0031F6AEE6|eukprot:scpid69740/ scgid25679/ Cyclin-D-binding Myb-like transcription factor 1; Cyclin-D-interacting Myb-like protein 1